MNESAFLPDSSAARLGIADVDCGLLDAVLALSFEPRELENLATRAGLETGACLCSRSRELTSTIHRACHQGGAFPRHLQRLLDVLHGRELTRLEEAGFDACAGALVRGDLWEVPDLAGRLWAVATSGDPQAPLLRRFLGRALQLDALRALRTLTQGPAALDAQDAAC